MSAAEATFLVTSTESKTEAWVPAAVHCPSCGTRGRVWTEKRETTFAGFSGDQHICVACGSRFWLTVAVLDRDGTHAQRLSALRARLSGAAA